MSDTKPTAAQELQAIGIVCQREGILTTPDNPTTLGLVLSLLQRLNQAEALTDRYLSLYRDSRRACYHFEAQAREARRLLEGMEEHAENARVRARIDKEHAPYWDAIKEALNNSAADTGWGDGPAMEDESVHTDAVIEQDDAE